jgi:multidrug efflux system outer membrane protein
MSKFVFRCQNVLASMLTSTLFRLLADACVFAAVAALAGCALQPPYVAPEVNVPATWRTEVVESDKSSEVPRGSWWRLLDDSAINVLIESTLVDSPTLAEAVTRIDEARAQVGINSASGLPSASISKNLARAQSQNTPVQGTSTTMLSSSASTGINLSWEIDIFGRVRQSLDSARNRLTARTADAVATRLALASEIANEVLSLRACESSMQVWAEDIASRERTLSLTRRRLATGFAAPVDEARAVSGITSSRTSLASYEQQCTQQVNAIVALTGKDPQTVSALVSPAEKSSERFGIYMPWPPASAPALPAVVLAQHPSVVSAEREVAAAWADIGIARANRMPRVDLAAALNGQWLRTAGSSLNFTTWTIGPALSGSLFDGGSGVANVSAAEARYRRAVANLQKTLRSAVQDVENALAAQISAQVRSSSTADNVVAARTTVRASEAQWKAGSISLFELEDSRRQFSSALNAEISARRDVAQAWISLLKATGGAITQTSEFDNHE